MNHHQHITLDIVLPVYNPHEGWQEDTLLQYEDFIAKLPKNITTSVILVNDGSPKNIDLEVLWLQEHIPNLNYIKHPRNKGKGQALRTGVEQCSSDYILYTDYDFPYATESMLGLVERMTHSDADIVIAARDDSYYRHLSATRRLISKILQTLNRIFLKISVHDTQGGLKIFSKSVQDIFLSTKIDRYLIDIEFLSKAEKKGKKVQSMVTQLRPEVKMTKVSNLNLNSELISYVKLLFNVQ